jgi:DNA-directed RNA polymerase subunit RPC12/RpoP
MQIRDNDGVQHLIDSPVNLRCPHCSTQTALIPISVPRFALLHRFRLEETGIVYRCSSCNRAVFLRHKVTGLSNPVTLSEEYEQITTSLEPFETQYLSGAVLDDFREALTCYANSCWNAFAAMCRRCIQSISETFGATGSTKVQAQLEELRSMGITDDDTFGQLRAIMLSGHDGAHPHLPALSPARATVLLQLMKDVLYQMFVRPAKIREAGELRKKAISKKQ